MFKLPRNMHLWIGSYLAEVFGSKEKPDPSQPIDLFFCLCDHFEPRWNHPTRETEHARVDTWLEKRPRIATGHRDADGRLPQHTFFFPEEEYRKEHIQKLAQLCRDGHGEVEIHLHHDHDNAEGLREKLERFKLQLAEESVLARTQSGEGRYAFIHGNWALDNSLPGGHACGVKNELKVLRETGCYADFTLPSAPSEAQTRTINSIYYASGDPERSKAHDTGTPVQVGKKPSGDLMIIQGPLTLNWSSRKWGVFPKIENGEISGDNPPTPNRVDLWVRQGICVQGRPNWVFIKTHTHGTQEENEETLLGDAMHRMWTYLETQYNDGRRYRLHYVTARQMYNVVKAAEDGLGEYSLRYLDYVIKSGFK